MPARAVGPHLSVRGDSSGLLQCGGQNGHFTWERGLQTAVPPKWSQLPRARSAPRRVGIAQGSVFVPRGLLQRLADTTDPVPVADERQVVFAHPAGRPLVAEMVWNDVAADDGGDEVAQTHGMRGRVGPGADAGGSRGRAGRCAGSTERGPDY